MIKFYLMFIGNSNLDENPSFLFTKSDNYSLGTFCTDVDKMFFLQI
jgi:hypothetical protein